VFTVENFLREGTESKIIARRPSVRKPEKRLPGYWKAYRENNPKKAERNRMLQTIRNRRRTKGQKQDEKIYESLIAKMDARKSNEFNPIGQFWLVPVIAKMDARKVNIYTITDRYH